VEIKDSEIINEILKGNKEQYALLMRKYNQKLYRIAKGYLKDEAEIEDVMQDTYVKGYQHLAKFEHRSEFSTWMTRILINECLQRLKKITRTDLMDVNEENNEIMNATDKNNPEKQSLNKELKDLLESAISQLPEKYRSVFMMREIEKMSIEETSAAMEISGSNVKIRLNRAKEMLRNTLMNTYPVGNLYEFNLIRCDRITANVLSRI
jgi:RNA polymerase sigma-70 factor (ECF subfamily)